MFELTVCGPTGPPVSHRFDQDRVGIGRASESDLVVREPRVSKHHAEIRRLPDRWLLVDVGSHNGTRLNGQPVAGEARLTPGDRIELCGVVILFELGAASSGRTQSDTASMDIRAFAGAGQGK